MEHGFVHPYGTMHDVLTSSLSTVYIYVHPCFYDATQNSLDYLVATTIYAAAVLLLALSGPCLNTITTQAIQNKLIF